ncbi:MAG TPA: universal stress protein [Gemmatimonadales bacterium]|nr:universal stress protein [Gemmatimonadales bacterium]
MIPILDQTLQTERATASGVTVDTRALRGVLVPLDGSELAEQALSVGAARARRTGATLHLVSVHEPVPLAAMPPDYPMPVLEMEAEATEQRLRYLESVAAWTRTALPTPVVASVVTGHPAAALCEYVGTHPVDLVVMTTHGRGGLGRLWLGSVADRLLRHVASPVLLLHPEASLQPTEFRHVLVALDGEIEAPVLEAAELLGCGGNRVRFTLTRVVEPALPVLTSLAARPAHLPPDWNAKLEVDARDYLSGLAERLGTRGWDVSWRLLVGRGVAARVLDLADTIGADAIVVGTHGARGLERLLLGSVAGEIVHGANVPVLVVPASPAERLRAPVPSPASANA